MYSLGSSLLNSSKIRKGSKFLNSFSCPMVLNTVIPAPSFSAVGFRVLLTFLIEFNSGFFFLFGSLQENFFLMRNKNLKKEIQMASILLSICFSSFLTSLSKLKANMRAKEELVNSVMNSQKWPALSGTIPTLKASA